MKKIPLKRLKAKAWNIMSLYVRLRDEGRCFTCGKVDSIQKMNAGHFKHHRLDFDERNIHCQCVSCNKFRGGKLDIYAERLEDMYGQGIIQELSAAANKIHRYTRTELEEIIEKYTRKLEALK